MSADPSAIPSGRELMHAVLDFWFGAPGSPEHGQQRAEWFTKNDTFDAQIRERFTEVVRAGLGGAYRDWLDSPRGSLAYVILLDQFPRNSFRGRAEAFAGDALALQATEQALAAGFHQQLQPVERMFLYLPLMHSEVLVHQDLSVALSQQLTAEAPQLDTLGFALAHREVIRRFGRFPQRNAALGRSSTPEELAYLTDAPRW